MYICRLFHRDQPFEQVDARLLADGTLSIGRDAAADWSLPDPEGTLSRIHCTLVIADGRLTVRDRSTNGTFLDDGSRAPRDADVPIDARQTLRLGAHLLLIDRAADAADATDPAGETCFGGSARTGPSPLAVARDASLIEAFCAGAGIDSSMLSSEDPADLMRRAGAVYRQSVLGLSQLIAERARAKTDHQLDRTTISAVDNNPFKWAPARRLVHELLCARDDGFLSGEAAVRAAFDDLAGHVAATAAASDAAIGGLLDALDPAAIDDAAARRGFSIRGRAAVCWALFVERHAALGGDATATAYRAGYVAAAAPPADR